MTRIAGLRIAYPLEKQKERKRSDRVSRTTEGSHVCRGGEAGVASVAYVTCAYRGAAAVVVNTVVMALIPSCDVKGFASARM